MMRHTVTLADVQMPYQARRHANADAIEQDVVDFANRMNINTQFFGDTNTLFAYLHPNTSFERLQIVGKLYALCWFLDDVWDGNLSQEELAAVNISYETSGTVIKEIAKIIKMGAMPAYNSPLLNGFYEVWQEFDHFAPKFWIKEFAKTVVDSLLTSHMTQQEYDNLFSFDDYLEVRDKDAGGIYTCLLMEFTNEIFLSEALRNHPTIALLRLLACRVGGLGNDLVSFHKEQLQDEPSYNAVSFLMDKRGMSFEDAANEVIDLHNQFLANFDEVVENLVWDNPDEIAQVEAYIDGLKEIMSGTWHWEMTTDRYRTNNPLFPELIA